MFKLSNYTNLIRKIKRDFKFSTNWNKVSKKEIKAFESFFNVKLDIISIHRPRDFLIKNNLSLAGRAHTYQDKYIKKKMIYISDSGGKNIVNKVKKLILDKKSIQLLIHPIWWINNLGNVNKTLNFFLRKKNLFLKKEIGINCKTYRR